MGNISPVPNCRYVGIARAYLARSKFSAATKKRIAACINRKEKEMKTNEAKYRTLFECSQDAIFLMYGDCYVDCNPAAVKLFGYENKKELLNRSPDKFSPEIQPDGQNSKEGVNIRTSDTVIGHAQKFPWRHVKKDGTEFDVEVSLNKVEIEGEPYFMAVLRTDSKVLCW